MTAVECWLGKRPDASALFVAIGVEELFDGDPHKPGQELVALGAVRHAQIIGCVVDSLLEGDEKLFWREGSNFGEGADFSNQPALLSAALDLVDITLQRFPQYGKLSQRNFPPRLL